MKKKYGFWVAVVLAAFIGHGCGQPLSMNIKIKTDNLNYSFNTKIADLDIMSVLRSKLVKEQLEFDIDAILENIVNENKNLKTLKLYDMINYKGAQAFLAAAQMDLVESFNPNDYLQEINIDLGKQPINPPPIELPKFTPDKINQVQWFKLKELFDTMENIINTTSTPDFDIKNIPLVTGSHSVPLPPFDMPHFMAWSYGDNTSPTPLAANFNSVVLDSGDVVLTLMVTSSPVDLMGVDGASITLKNITLVGEKTGNLIGTPQNISVTLNAANSFQETIRVSLADIDISCKDSPVFKIGGVATTNESTTMVEDIIINVQPQLSGIALRGAKGLKIGSMNPSLPTDVANSIKFDNLPADFINAKIAEGDLIMEIQEPLQPPGDPKEVRQTYFEGITITYNIVIKQDPVIFDDKVFKGLSKVNLIPPANGKNQNDWSPWIINTPHTPLNGKNISGNPISVVDTKIKIEITDLDPDPDKGGASFELFDDDIYHTANADCNAFTDKALPVTFNMDMAIRELQVVRWKNRKQGGGPLIVPPAVPSIDFGNIGGSDIANFIESIVFETLTATIDFTKPDGKTSGLPKALENRLAFKLVCPDLGFNDLVTLKAGENIFTGNPPNPFELKDGNGDAKVLNPKLTFASVIMDNPNDDNSPTAQVENAEYFELGSLVIDDDSTVIDIYGMVSFDFNWKSATIAINNILAAKGGIDGAFTGEFPVGDLSGTAEFMHGFMFSDISIQMVFGGPHAILEMLKPTLKLKAEYLKLNEHGDWEPADPDSPENVLVDESLHTVNGGNLARVLSDCVDNKGNYIPTDLPVVPNAPSPITNLDKILGLFPKDLKFNYEMTLPDRVEIVHSHMFDFDEGDSAIKALIMIKLPLILEAERDNARFTILEEKDKDGNPTGDILGRTFVAGGTPEDIFGNIKGDVNITKAAITIEFGGNIFGEARLHLDGNPNEENRLFGKDGLLLMPNGGNNLTVVIDNNDFKKIRDNFIHPNVRITFKEGSKLTIPRDILPAKISFSASGEYTIPVEFDL